MGSFLGDERREPNGSLRGAQFKKKSPRSSPSTALRRSVGGTCRRQHPVRTRALLSPGPVSHRGPARGVVPVRRESAVIVGLAGVPNYRGDRRLPRHHDGDARPTRAVSLGANAVPATFSAHNGRGTSLLQPRSGASPRQASICNGARRLSLSPLCRRGSEDRSAILRRRSL